MPKAIFSANIDDSKFVADFWRVFLYLSHARIIWISVWDNCRPYWNPPVVCKPSLPNEVLLECFHYFGMQHTVCFSGRLKLHLKIKGQLTEFS